VGEIRCKGDGTPGEFIYFDTCNEYRENRDPSHPGYGGTTMIMNEHRKKHLELIFNRALFVQTGGGISPEGIHHIEGITLDSWTRKGIEEIINYKLHPVGTICAKIIEY